MLIRVQCSCGATFRAPEELEGKTVKCPTCEQPVKVEHAEPIVTEQMELGGILCPNCNTHVPPDIQFCPHCGYRLREGHPSHRGVESPTSVRPTPKGRLWLMVLVLLLLLGAAGAVWFVVVRPMRAEQALTEAMQPVREGNYREAIRHLEAARGLCYGEYLEQVEFRLAQLGMEEAYGPIGPGDRWPTVRVEATPELRQEVGETLLLLHLRVENTGKEPVVLRDGLFYLRSDAGIALPVPHATDSINGGLAEPGQTAEGIVAFRRLPGADLRADADELMGPWMLVFNDGQQYATTAFMLTGALGEPGLQLR